MIGALISRYVVPVIISTVVGYVVGKSMKMAKSSVNKRMPGNFRI